MWQSQSLRMFRARKKIQGIVSPDLNGVINRHIHRQSSFYDSLGVTPKATQADIKTAFYKLSMQFHPDKVTGDGSKFREINAAYEILGNLKLRKLYDSGYLPNGQPHSQNVRPPRQDIHEDAKNMYEEMQYNEFRRQQQQWRPPQSPEEFIRQEKYGRRGPMNWKEEHYNYDEWTRNHYSEAFFRGRAVRGPQRWTSQKQHEYEMAEKRMVNRITRVIIGSMVVLFFLGVSTPQNFDAPRRYPPSL